MQDSELLREYVKTGSDAAFTELVGRHVDLVYATALRLLRESQTAKDVSQAVFIRLARKAGTVREGNALAGWLYRAVCYEAASAIRTEQRRRLREAEAVKLSQLESDTSSVWQAVQPLLDEGLNKLGRLEQDAVLLRFLENKPLSEVGQTLGLTEEAARKRVSRALEKLRTYFARQGLKVSSTMLISALGAHAMQAAPAGLAAGLAAASLAGGSTLAASGLTLNLIENLIMTKLKTATVTVLVVAAVGIPVFLQRSNAHLKAENEKLQNQLRQQTSEFTELQTSLTREVETLQAQLQQTQAGDRNRRPPITTVQNRAASESRAPAVASAPASGATSAQEQDFVRVKRSNISRLQFDVLTPDLQLADPAIDLLELNTEELARIKALVGEFRKNVQNHDLSHVTHVSPSEIPDPDIKRFLTGKEGQASTYRIAPYPQQEAQVVREWLGKSLHEIIGPERSESFLKNGRYTLDYWLGNTEDKVLAFIDRSDSQGKFVEREWMVKFKTPSSSGTYSGKGPEAVPVHMRYLYDAAGATPSQ